MRNLILAKEFVAGVSYEEMTDGQLAIFSSFGSEGLNVGAVHRSIGSPNAEDYRNEPLTLVLKRSAERGGDIVLPLYANNFSYSDMSYEEATHFEAEVTIPEITNVGTHSIIIAKKGKLFNERNKWTVSTYVKDITMGSDKLAESLAKQINATTASHGIVAEVSDATITLTAAVAGEDYEILPADALMGVEVMVDEIGMSGRLDAKHIADLAAKAAADAGVVYTYRDASADLYPNFPIDLNKAFGDNESGTFDDCTLFTLRFAEPRAVKTRDEVVNQIVQVLFKNNGNDFRMTCNVLAGGTYSEEE